MTILLVDGDLDELHDTAWVLKRAGYKVATTANFDEAKQLIAQAAPAFELIISGSCLHGEEGLSIYKLIKGFVPFILYTGNEQKIGEAKSYDSNIPTVAKNCDFERIELLDVIKGLLERPIAKQPGENLTSAQTAIKGWVYAPSF